MKTYSKTSVASGENTTEVSVNPNFSLGSTSTSNFPSDSLWSTPNRIEVREAGESIEFIYKQTYMISNGLLWEQKLQERVFKIVYSCKDGKWNKSEPIFGKIIPQQQEYYEF